MISTCLYSHNILSIFPMSFRNFPYIAFLLYFGLITMWYWHTHFVCDKLFSLFWTDLLLLLCAVGVTRTHFSKRRSFFSASSLPLFPFPTGVACGCFWVKTNRQAHDFVSWACQFMLLYPCPVENPPERNKNGPNAWAWLGRVPFYRSHNRHTLSDLDTWYPLSRAV